MEQRWVQANDAHFSSFIAGMLVSADQRRVGEIGLIDPMTGEQMPVEACHGWLDRSRMRPVSRSVRAPTVIKKTTVPCEE